jgi:hypothetical protein
MDRRCGIACAKAPLDGRITGGAGVLLPLGGQLRPRLEDSGVARARLLEAYSAQGMREGSESFVLLGPSSEFSLVLSEICSGGAIWLRYGANVQGGETR